MRGVLLLGCAVLAALGVSTARPTAAGPAPDGAGVHHYTIIAETGPELRSIGRFAMNDSGTVAFHASDARGYLLLTSDGGRLRRVQEQSKGFFGSGPLDINEAGEISLAGFDATSDQGGLFLSDGRAGLRLAIKLPKFTNSDDGTIDPASGLPFRNIETNSSGLNNEGVLAFDAVSGGQGITGHFGVYTVRAGAVTPIETIRADLLPHALFPDINDAGSVAYMSSTAIPEPRREVKVDGQTLFDTDGPFASFNEPSINNKGTVAFSASFDDGTPSAVILRRKGERQHVVVAGGPAFRSIGSGEVSINDADEVAFLATLPDGRFGIFTGPDPEADRVVVTGDLLCGAAVRGVSLFRDSLNNAGQLAFGAVLADGRSVIARTDAGASGTLKGRVDFEKIPVTKKGLQPSATFRAPAPNILVEAVDKRTDEVVARTFTREDGTYTLCVSRGSKIRVRAVAQDANGTTVAAPPEVRKDKKADPIVYALVSKALTVARGTKGPKLLAVVNGGKGIAGAFNILATIHRANAFVRTADSSVQFAPVKVIWPRLVITDADLASAYSAAENTIFVTGEQDRDTDEFDDTVLAHEYGHFLAARFSRTDSPGGLHAHAESLDPRLAWGEGWSDFFGCAVNDTPFFRDTLGKRGKRVSGLNLEKNPPASTDPGYWQDMTVSSFLWDVLDTPGDAGDQADADFLPLWDAFKALATHSFVYLIDFCDLLARRNSSLRDPMIQILAERGIEYTFDVEPSVPDPFPGLIASGVAVQGEADSLTDGKGNALPFPRKNLLRSSQFFQFRLRAPSHVTAELTDLAGVQGTTGNLDLLLLNEKNNPLEQVVAFSDNKGVAPERLEADLPAGLYVLEVRSWRNEVREADNGKRRTVLVGDRGTFRLTAAF
jgi:hypothetical protein